MQHTIEGILFYYPFRGGKETRPGAPCPFANLPIKSKQKRQTLTKTAVARVKSSPGGKGLSQKGSNRTSSSSSSSSSSNSRGLSNHDDNVIDLVDDSDSDNDFFELNQQSGEKEDPSYDKNRKEYLLKTVCVYWQNRCVPNTFLQKLPFFPSVKGRLQCSTEHLPEQWNDRIKGYLFFDNKFNHISNNKLQLLFDQGIENWLRQHVKVRRLRTIFFIFTCLVFIQ